MEHIDEWGDGSLRVPRFESQRANTTMTVAKGKFELVSTITPKPANPPPAVARRILLFVRADVLPVSTGP